MSLTLYRVARDSRLTKRPPRFCDIQTSPLAKGIRGRVSSRRPTLLDFRPSEFTNFSSVRPVNTEIGRTSVDIASSFASDSEAKVNTSHVPSGTVRAGSPAGARARRRIKHVIRPDISADTSTYSYVNIFLYLATSQLDWPRYRSLAVHGHRVSRCIDAAIAPFATYLYTRHCPRIHMRVYV